MSEPPISAEATAPSRPARLNLERARAMIADWRESGIDRASYAARRGIHLKTFDRWRSRVEGSSRAAPSRLARVALASSEGGADFHHALRVIPGPQAQVVLPEDWNAEILRRVLEACRC